MTAPGGLCNSACMMRTRNTRHWVGALVWCVLLGMIGLACGGKPKPARRGTPDAVAAGAKPDGAVRPAPPRRKIALGPGCVCAPRADGDPSVKVARKALVRRLDRLNGGLRSLMAQIDRAVPDEPKDRIIQPAPLQADLRRLTCRLDCLLYQFPWATPALWSYLAVAARFLDEAHHAVGRLTAPPKGRPTGLSITGLTQLFNFAAQTSNESIGLALLSRRAPTVEVGVDASSFRSKVRRWREKLRETTSAFERRWLPLIRRAKPEGPALGRPRRLRVALARLRQRLHRLANQAQAIACKRGKGCTKPQSSWVTMQRNLKELGAHLRRLAQELRAAGPTVSLSEGRRLSQSTQQSFAAVRKAALSL